MGSRSLPPPSSPWPSAKTIDERESDGQADLAFARFALEAPAIERAVRSALGGVAREHTS